MAVTQIRSGQVNVNADFDIQSHKLLNVSNPTSANDAANKSYVDNAAQGLRNFKDSVRAVSQTNLTLSGTQTVDGVALIAGDRILVAGQTTASANGIYVVAAGAWSRSTDANVSADVQEGMAVVVVEGTTNADTLWIMNTAAPTLGTTSLSFVKMPSGSSYSAGNGINITSNVVSLATLNSGNIFVGNGSNAATSVAVTGDVTISNAGVTTVSTNTSTGFTKYSANVTRETPTGLVNGANTTYTLANTPVAGTEDVYINGILMDSGAGNDYTISGNTITMLFAPATGDKIRVSYLK